MSWIDVSELTDISEVSVTHLQTGHHGRFSSWCHGEHGAIARLKRHVTDGGGKQNYSRTDRNRTAFSRIKMSDKVFPGAHWSVVRLMSWINNKPRWCYQVFIRSVAFSRNQRRNQTWRIAQEWFFISLHRGLGIYGRRQIRTLNSFIKTRLWRELVLLVFLHQPR